MSALLSQFLMRIARLSIFSEDFLLRFVFLIDHQFF